MYLVFNLKYEYFKPMQESINEVIEKGTNLDVYKKMNNNER